jgi:hypothetical protein
MTGASWVRVLVGATKVILPTAVGMAYGYLVLTFAYRAATGFKGHDYDYGIGVVQSGGAICGALFGFSGGLAWVLRRDAPGGSTGERPSQPRGPATP